MDQETLSGQREQDTSEQETIRREKLAQMREDGMDPFAHTTFPKTHLSRQIIDGYDKLAEKTVAVAGRIMSRRIMGKASFVHILDEQGTIQLYVRRDDVGEDAYKLFKTLDIGDIIGVTGFVFKTKTEEVSVHAQSLEVLAKSLIPLPEKFHGLKDTDLRYRQRYVDLIMNQEVRQAFVTRAKIVSSMRNFLDEKGFMEVETPILQTTAGGAAARPFITHHNTLDIDMYLRIATELHLKRLIVGGFEKVYEIGRIFRNEGMDPKHNPEFTTIELYQAYTDVNGIMDLTEALVANAAKVARGEENLSVQFEGQAINLRPPYKRVKMVDIVKEKTGVDFLRLTDEQARVEAKRLKIEDIKEGFTRGQCLYAAFEEFVEDTLIQPTFVLDYPVEVSPLAKRSKEDKAITERFELFVCGRELANAFSELNDPLDQYERFMAQAKARAEGDEEAHMMDDDFVTALSYGMPPTGGMGMGIDRLCMLLTEQNSIRDVLLFPTMKPLDSDKKVSKEVSAPAEATQTAPVVEEKIDFSNVQIEPLFQDQVDFDTFSKSDFRAVKVKECEAVKKSKKLLKFVLDDGTGVDRVILSGIHEYYEPEELVGKTCIAITNLPPRAMMGIDSCGMLISAVHHENGEEKLHLLMVDPHIPAGAKLY